MYVLCRFLKFTRLHFQLSSDLSWWLLANWFLIIFADISISWINSSRLCTYFLPSLTRKNSKQPVGFTRMTRTKKIGFASLSCIVWFEAFVWLF